MFMTDLEMAMALFGEDLEIRSNDKEIILYFGSLEMIFDAATGKKIDITL